MRFVRLGAVYVNPEAVAAVSPDPLNAVQVHLVGGQSIRLTDATVDAVAFTLVGDE